jgi:hypothetical protein
MSIREWRWRVRTWAAEVSRALRSDYFFWVILLPLVFFLVYGAVNIRQIYRPYDPLADNAILRLQVERAREFRELLGPYSRFHFNHPGPLLFYYTALAEVAFFFLPAGRWFAAEILYNTFFLIVALHIVYYSFKPRPHPYLLAAAVFFALSPLGPSLYISPWGPANLVLPTVVFLLSAIALAQQRPRYLLPLVVAASFIGQTHVGGLLIVVPLTLLALTFYAIRSLIQRRSLDRVDRLCLLGSILFLLVSLVPPLYEQFMPGGGNLGKLYDFFILGQDASNLARGHPLAESLPFVLSFYTAPFATAGLPRLAPFLALLVVAVALAQLRPRRSWLNTLVLFLGAAFALSVWGAMSVAGALNTYLMWFEYGLVALWLFLFLVGVYEAGRLLLEKVRVSWSPRPPAFLRYGAVVATLIVTVVLGYRFTVERSDVVPRFIQALDPRPDRTYYLWWKIGSSSHAQWRLAAGLVLKLYEQGYDVCVPPEWDFAFGPALVCRTLPENVYPVFLSNISGATVTSYEKIFTYDPAHLPGATMEAGQPRFPFVLWYNSGETFFSGWSGAENGYRWSERPEASIYFFVQDLPAGVDHLDLVLQCLGYQEQRVQVLVNQTPAGEITVPGGDFRQFVIPFAADQLRDRAMNEVTFLIPGAARPGTEDPRMLGIALQEMSIQARAAPLSAP